MPLEMPPERMTRSDWARAFSIPARVDSRSSGDFGRSPGVHSRSEGESVGLPKLIGERSFVWRNEFVAGAENGDPGEEGDFEFGGSDGRGHAEMSWPDFGAG